MKRPHPHGDRGPDEQGSTRSGTALTSACTASTRHQPCSSGTDSTESVLALVGRSDSGESDGPSKRRRVGRDSDDAVVSGREPSRSSSAPGMWIEAVLRPRRDGGRTIGRP